MKYKFKPADILTCLSADGNVYHILIYKPFMRQLFKRKRRFYQYLILETGIEDFDTATFIERECKKHA